jgi:hypothetical protein
LSALRRRHQGAKSKFSPIDLNDKISVPVVLSVAGTMITILSYFSMEGERQMEQTRKLLADAFDKDPIKQQYCIFYVDHLLASGRMSPQMTVSVLSSVAANATNDNVRLDALRRMPQLLEQKNYQQELKPLLVRSNCRCIELIKLFGRGIDFQTRVSGIADAGHAAYFN